MRVSTLDSASSRTRIARLAGQRAGERQALLLAARERDAALADDGVVAVREGVEVGGDAGDLRGPADDRVDGGIVGDVEAEGDVVADRGREQERILRHEADGAAQLGERQRADVAAVEQHGAVADVEQARQQLHERALAGAGAADDGELLARARW